jgi:hypothetical protein
MPDGQSQGLYPHPVHGGAGVFPGGADSAAWDGAKGLPLRALRGSIRNDTSSNRVAHAAPTGTTEGSSQDPCIPC